MTIIMWTEKICVCLILAAVHVQDIHALVEPLQYLPADLQGYLDTCHSFGDLSQQSAKLVFWTSINQYTSKFIKSRPHLTPQQTTYLRSNLAQVFSPLYPAGMFQGSRVKRQAFGTRIRKEIRSMRTDERQRYFAAVNAMKNDRSLPPNVYDFISAYHSGDNIARAHFGPAFPGWHRLYLWIFEYFLRLQDPSATIPYWASVLDNDMEDATQSLLWSPEFYGNADGAIRTGPFRNWAQINPQTSFTRNIQGGELYSFDGINRILSRTRNEEILIPTANPDSDFEMQHGAAHVFVGGSMNRLDTAARDPIFFSHHCFVDQIWERFRFNQSINGIDPQTDYPFDSNDPRFSPGHSPTSNAGFERLGGAQTWTQNLGYLNVFSQLVAYERVPACPQCANPRYLFCNRRLTPARCVSRTTAEMRGTSFRNNLGTPTVSTRSGRSLSMRVQQPSPSITVSQDSSLDVCPRRSFINDIDTRRFGVSPATTSIPDNTWAYIPIKVVSKRPIEYNKFDKYSLYNQGTRGQIGLKDEFTKRGVQKRYESCEKLQGDVGKITIVSYGLNYDGFSEEYVLMDNRLGVSEASGYIPVKMPSRSKPSEAIVAAFDSCGRVCRPYCMQVKSGATVMDNTFSGGIRVSSASPQQYAHSYADAMLNIWDITSKSSCPTINHNNIPISFFCEYTDTWIWGPAIPVPGRGTGMVDHVGGTLPSPIGHHVGLSSLGIVPSRRGGQVGRGVVQQGVRGVHHGRGRSGRPPHRAGIPFRGSSALTHLLPSLDIYSGRRAGRTAINRRTFGIGR